MSAVASLACSTSTTRCCRSTPTTPGAASWSTLGWVDADEFRRAATTRSTPTTRPARSTSTPTSRFATAPLTPRARPSAAGRGTRASWREVIAPAIRDGGARHWCASIARPATWLAIVTADQRLRHGADRRRLRRSTTLIAVAPARRDGRAAASPAGSRARRRSAKARSTRVGQWLARRRGLERLRAHQRSTATRSTTSRCWRRVDRPGGDQSRRPRCGPSPRRAAGAS